MSGRASMGDPALSVPLRERLIQMVATDDLAAGRRLAPAYDVGHGVVMLSPIHPLLSWFADRAAAGLAAGRDEQGRNRTCRHLPRRDHGPWDVHWVCLEPDWAWCAGCARGLLAQLVGDRRRCLACDGSDVGGRLQLVRAPTGSVDEYGLSRHDAWGLLCPRCLGPVAIR